MKPVLIYSVVSIYGIAHLKSAKSTTGNGNLRCIFYNKSTTF